MYFCVTITLLKLVVKLLKLGLISKSKVFMQKMQRGFTLIELVVVIVVLGILSAVAVPKYIDYKEGAGAAAFGSGQTQDADLGRSDAQAAPSRLRRAQVGQALRCQLLRSKLCNLT